MLGTPIEIPTIENPRPIEIYLDAMERQLADESLRIWNEKLERSGILFYIYAPVRRQIENSRYR